MEKIEWIMLNDGSCTIRGGKEKKFKNELNKINMVQGIKMFLGWKNNLKHNYWLQQLPKEK